MKLKGVSKWTVAFLLLSSTQLLCQTNTFPSTGDVGMGTTAPPTSLFIYGPFTPGYMQLGIQSTAADDRSGLSLWNSTGVRMASFFASSSHNSYLLGTEYTDGIFHIDIAGVERMTFLPNGYIGLGTTTPVSALHIAGDNVEIAMGRLVSDTNAYTRFGMSTAYDTYWASNATNAGGQWDYVAPGGWGGLASRIDQFNGAIQFDTTHGGTNPITWTTHLYVSNGGNVGIGTIAPAYPLSVNGTIEAKEVIVNSGWSDYVFEKAYRLTPLSDVERSIQANGHLPGMPSAREVTEKGIRVGEIEAKLLAKIEELTLHEIEQAKRLDAQDEVIAKLQARVAALQR